MKNELRDVLIAQLEKVNKVNAEYITNIKKLY